MIRASFLAVALLLAGAAAHAEDVTICERGVAVYHGGDRDAAIDLYTRCLSEGDLTPDNRAIVLGNRAVAYLDTGQYDLALADLEQAISLNPADGELYRGRGALYSLKGQHDRALQDYNLALSLNPNDAYTLRNRGNAYAALGQNDLAIADYTETIRLDPSDQYAYYARAEVGAAAGQYDQAIEDMMSGFRVAPDDVAGFQERLADAGYYAGAVNGVAGPEMRSALDAWARDGMP